MADDIDLVARRLVAMAERDDATFTGMLEAVAAAAGGVLVGLDNRVKTVESLIRKLGDMLTLDQELSLPGAADRTFDVLRFTVVANPALYLEICAAVLTALEEEGGTVVEERNRWRGPGYRGINVRLSFGADQRVEGQFHTRDSYEAVKATRGQYEELRDASTSPARAADLAAAIEVAFANVPLPPGTVS